MSGFVLQGLSAQAVAWTAGVGCGLALLFFLLRPRPPEVVVSSHVLWDQVLPKRRNPLVKDLLLLLLQVLALLGLALALGEPAAVDEAVAEEAAIRQRLWVVDRSLSMGAQQDGRSRIERVADELRSQLEALPPDVSAGLVGAADTPEILAPLGDDRQRLDLALRLLDVGGVEADLPGALQRAIAQPGLSRDEGIIELFSDDPDAPALAAAFTAATGWTVLVRAPFEPLPNAAITTFDLRASEGIPAEEEALVRVRNRSPWPVTLRLSLETTTTILGEAELSLEAGQELTRRYRFRPLDPGGVEAVLRGATFETPDGARPDALPDDDRAYAWIQPVRPVSVVLVSGGNRYLERVLALLPGVELTKAKPADWSRVAGRARRADVVFLDGFVPPDPQPPRAVYVGPPAGGPFELGPSVPTPAVTDWRSGHPLFSGLVLRDLQIQEASVLVEQPGDERLVGSPRGALALARQDGATRHVAWGFDFGRSDLPLRLAFPQIVVNAVLWMREGRAVGPPPGGRQRLDEPLWLGVDGPLFADGLRADEEASAPTITDLRVRDRALADGDERAAARASSPLPLGDGLLPLRLPRAGLVRVAANGWSHDVALNLFDVDEGDLVRLPPHDATPVAPPPAKPPVEPTDPLWLLLAAGCGLVLLIEFGLYTR